MSSLQSLIKIQRYSEDRAQEWNEFVDTAKNATFLFKRQYVDYHRHRFTDHSIMIYQDKKLSALFVANETDDTIESHGGLTYGGLILEPTVRLEKALQYLFHTVKYYASGFRQITYKCFPSYLAKASANEDLYGLFLLDARLVRRDTSIVLDLTKPLPMESKRSRSFKAFGENKYRIAVATDPEKFWSDILVPNLLDRFGAEPVHNVSEMRLLMQRFPDNIRLYELYDQEIVAGAVVYISPAAAHLQYISSNAKGREIEATSVLIYHLVAKEFSDKGCFSFGTSNGEGGRQLNKGLVSWKEGFGGGTFVHDFYEIQTDNYKLLKDYE